MDKWGCLDIRIGFDPRGYLALEDHTTERGHALIRLQGIHFRDVGREKEKKSWFRWLVARVVDWSAMRAVVVHRFVRGLLFSQATEREAHWCIWTRNGQVRMYMDAWNRSIRTAADERVDAFVDERSRNMDKTGRKRSEERRDEVNEKDTQRSPITKKQREGTFSVRQVASSKVPRLALKRTSAIIFSAMIPCRGIDFLNLPAT
ncbi:hypothetical protein WN48_02511 [Eufriesea mexicana]|uniref:Uncharacterized protein n=1 Tax=Eufriesea mexicana TaxID=516756 RepID=A0A310S755_9HYME|nr:hypothetical protein WN48_02511 [Eufriesea mexicana]